MRALRGARHVGAGTGRGVAHLAVAVVMVRGVGARGECDTW